MEKAATNNTTPEVLNPGAANEDASYVHGLVQQFHCVKDEPEQPMPVPTSRYGSDEHDPRLHGKLKAHI